MTQRYKTIIELPSNPIGTIVETDENGWTTMYSKGNDYAMFKPALLPDYFEPIETPPSKLKCKVELWVTDDDPLGHDYLWDNDARKSFEFLLTKESAEATAEAIKAVLEYIQCPFGIGEPHDHKMSEPYGTVAKIKKAREVVQKENQ